MSDIVERLRDQGRDAFAKHYSLGMFKLCADAADEIERLQGVLFEAALQIEYLHAKFKSTGTGEATLARIRAALPLPSDHLASPNSTPRKT